MLKRIGYVQIACMAFLCFFSSFFNYATAQRGGFLNRSEMLFAGGGMTYLGDLNGQSVFGEVSPAASVGVRSRIDNRWALRGSFSYGALSASKDCLPARNLSFSSRLFEAAFVAEFDFRPYGAGATESFWSPYLFGGLALFHFNPMASYTFADGTVEWVALQPLCTEGQGTSVYPERRPYALTQIALPFGVGVRLRLGKQVSMAVEYGFRKTWTDYIDDVSKTYVGAELLVAEVRDGGVSAQLADRSAQPNAAGIKRGDDSLNDWYSFFNLSVGVNMELLFGWMRSKRCRN